jgi:hypothetical protein
MVSMQVSTKIAVLNFIETGLIKESTEGASTQPSKHVPNSNHLEFCLSLRGHLIAQAQFASL